MNTATKSNSTVSTASASGKGQSTTEGKGQSTTEGKGVTLTPSTTIDGHSAFNVIGGNCQTMQQCCSVIEEKMKGFANMPDASAEWTALKQCIADCLGACESGTDAFDVGYAPQPTVLCPV